MVTEQEINDICKKAIEIWGASFQEDMWIEESSELTKAILKLRRVKRNSSMLDIYNKEEDIVKEIVDCELMIKEMKVLYVNCPRTQKLYEETLEYKINRLKDMLTKDGKEN